MRIYLKNFATFLRRVFLLLLLFFLQGQISENYTLIVTKIVCKTILCMRIRASPCSKMQLPYLSHIAICLQYSDTKTILRTSLHYL